jgi:hypothetical protein
LGCFASIASGAPITVGRAVLVPTTTPLGSSPTSPPSPPGAELGASGMAAAVLNAQQLLGAQLGAIRAALPLGAPDAYPQVV